jgi:hypothetical protein
MVLRHDKHDAVVLAAPPPPVTYAGHAGVPAAAPSSNATSTPSLVSTTTAAPPPPQPHDVPSPGAQQLRLSGNDNGTAIVVGLTLAAVVLVFAFLAARKFRQERRIRETVRMQQLLAQHQQAMHTGAAGGGGSEGSESLRSHDDARSTITQNVRRDMAGTASNASTTVSPGRPLGGVRRGRSKTMRTPSLASQRTLTLPTPAASQTSAVDRGSLSFSSQFGDLL